jgi:D-beta-D-heptose 7-phosphate kinase/D-beta-D-heptose 1-phosphate adenosyltransferase
MQNLYTVVASRKQNSNSLSEGEVAGVAYHDLFDFPLNFSELIKWKMTGKILTKEQALSRNGFYFLEGREGLIYKRALRARTSIKKMEIAKRAAKVLSFIPTIKMVAVTGSLAMENASEESDIDLMIVSKKGTLWSTRLLSYLVIWLFGIKTRKPKDTNEKDSLCLNIWLDESDLVWGKTQRNIYTAHEIAQIVPLTNKEEIYEKFLYKNKWILNFWPNSVKIRNPNIEIRKKLEFSKFKFLNIVSDFVLSTSNLIAYKMQYLHMRSKITREVATPTRALFHPQDWSKVVLSRLSP